MSLWHPTKPAYPIADNTYDLGSSTLRWRGLYLAGAANVGTLQIGGTTVINSSRNLVGINVVAQNLVPDADITRNLGSSSYHFYTLYCGYMQRANGPISILPYSELNIGGGNSYRWQITTSGHLIPFSDNSYDIGSSSLRVRNLYLAGTANVGSLQIGGTTVIDSSRNLVGLASVAQTLLPDADNTRALGSSTYRWSDVRTALLNGWNPDSHASRHAYGGADAVSLDASQITSGRLSLSRLPTSATANRFLVVRTANADPTYDQVDWNTDIKNKPSTFPPSAHASTHEYGGTDLVRNLDYLAIRGTTVITSGSVLQNIASVAQTLLPDTDNTYDLGSSSYRWRYLYFVYKSAAFKHPLHNPERYIVFKCVESPKVTVEDWGIAELKNGKAFVGFSEEFVALMSDKAEYAVFLTPEGECNGLYVSKKEFYGFEVKELNNGKSNVRFSWHVKAIRIGDEETPVLEEPAPTEPEKREEWEAKRREADKEKEEDRLNRMKQKIAKYREVTRKS
jgi:hypothetical protein